MVEGLPVSALTFKFLTYGKGEIQYLSEEEGLDFRERMEDDAILVLAKRDEKLIETLNLNCSAGSFYTYNPGEPNEFFVYKIPKGSHCGGS